jgi:hypothetical protein
MTTRAMAAGLPWVHPTIDNYSLFTDSDCKYYYY